jgi:hypothetical protein
VYPLPARALQRQTQLRIIALKDQIADEERYMDWLKELVRRRQ